MNTQDAIFNGDQNMSDNGQEQTLQDEVSWDQGVHEPCTNSSSQLVLLYVLLAEKYERVPLAKACGDETVPYKSRQRKPGCRLDAARLAGVQRPKIQTATQQKQETSVSVWTQSP